MAKPVVVKIGKKLRDLSEEVTTEPLPKKMEDLLKQLARNERKDKSGPNPPSGPTEGE